MTPRPGRGEKGFVWHNVLETKMPPDEQTGGDVEETAVRG